MLKNRPIVNVTIGYILGIIVGLYLNKSIVLFYIIIYLIYLLLKCSYKKGFKLLSAKRYFRYIKMIFTKKVCIIIIATSFISNLYVLAENNSYLSYQEKMNNKSVQIKGKVVSNEITSRYKKMYKIKLYENGIFTKNIYIKLNKNQKHLNYGDEIKFEGTFNKPTIQRNYKGFNYAEYLKTKKIYGIVNDSNIKVIKENSGLLKIANDILLKIESKLKMEFNEKESEILLGLILGDTTNMEDDIKNNFSESNISHILAVSGMHIGYIIIMCKIFIGILGTRKTNILTIIILIIYILIIGFHVSAIRAIIIGIITLGGKILYRKSDIWTNISISLLFLLIYNPFLINDSGLILSYTATISIIIYINTFKRYNVFFVTFAVSIMLMPILAVIFNKIPIMSIYISCFIGFIIIPIFILGIIFILFSSFELFPIFIIKKVISIFIKILLKISEIGAIIPLNKIYVVTPNVFSILIYYFIILVLLFIYCIYHKNKKNAFVIRVRNLISLFKYKYQQNKNKIVLILILGILVCLVFKIIPGNLNIYFIDVGQGDSSLIVTPTNKKILIDGGGSDSDNYDVGKNVLIPYLLDRRIKIIDYIIISHFDTDHVRSVF